MPAWTTGFASSARSDPDARHEEDGNLVQVLYQVIDTAGDGLPFGAVEVLATGGRVIVAGRMSQSESP